MSIEIFKIQTSLLEWYGDSNPIYQIKSILVFLPPFQKKVLIKSSIFFMIPTGANRIENLNRGRLLSMDFMRTAFPGKFSQEDPQTCNFSLNLSNNDIQSLPNTLEWNMGKPKYLNEDHEIEIANPKQQAMEFAVEVGMFQL